MTKETQTPATKPAPKAKPKAAPKVAQPTPAELVVQELRGLLRSGVNSVIRYSHLVQAMDRHGYVAPSEDTE